MSTRQLDVTAWRREFPALDQKVHGKPLVYLDNAATAQKPRAVIDAVATYYDHDCANVHRGVHALAERATVKYEAARDSARRFLNAPDRHEVVFTHGTTESLNLVAQSLGRLRLRAGDEVVISAMEHHSNIVPWQLVCESTGAFLKVAPIDERGELDLAAFERLLSPRTKIVSLTHVSNALGTINPVREVAGMAHAHGALLVVDGAQAAPHLTIDVQQLGCDFYALSGHKAYGPTGIGVLWGKSELLQAMPPYQGGGEMIASVTFERTTYAPLPHKFEAGTPHIAGAIGLGAALDFLAALDRRAVAQHEEALLARATAALAEVPGLHFLGTARQKGPLVTFVLECAHAHDVATVLDQEGVAVRGGHHCAQPVMERFGVDASVRASFALYNTLDEVDVLARGLKRVREVLRT